MYMNNHHDLKFSLWPQKPKLICRKCRKVWYMKSKYAHFFRFGFLGRLALPIILFSLFFQLKRTKLNIAISTAIILGIDWIVEEVPLFILQKIIKKKNSFKDYYTNFSDDDICQ